VAESCPKCGFPQVEGDECPRCRTSVSRYRAYLQGLGQQPARAAAPAAAPAWAPPPAAAPAGEWPEGAPAGFWVRGAALTVDSIVLQAAFLPFQLLIVAPTLLVGGLARGADPTRAFAVNVAYNVVAVLVYAGYWVWMHGRWGQTLGKVATGVKVVTAAGEPIGYGRSLGRFVAYLLSSVLTLGIGHLIAAFREDKRALHDLVAGTRVIKVARPWLEGRPSGFWMRYLALSIDWYVIVLVLLPPFALFIALTAVAAGLGRLQESAIAAVAVTFVLFFVALTVAYGIWMHGRWGQTLGKMALGMKVVRVDGSPLGYGGAFVRWLGSVLSAVTFMIGFLIAGLRSDKRALHDLIAGSRVTYVR
jgi:uncharacterized RDD family membrane protein YckC